MRMRCAERSRTRGRAAVLYRILCLAALGTSGFAGSYYFLGQGSSKREDAPYATAAR